MLWTGLYKIMWKISFLFAIISAGMNIGYAVRAQMKDGQWHEHWICYLRENKQDGSHDIACNEQKGNIHPVKSIYKTGV